MRRSRVAVLFTMIAVMHLLWAGLLFTDRAAFKATPVAGIARIINEPTIAGVLLIVASALSLFVWRARAEIAILFVLGQQAILSLSAINALHAVWAGQYADGEPRPWAFILADQTPVLALLVLHTASIYLLVRDR